MSEVLDHFNINIQVLIEIVYVNAERFASFFSPL